MRAFQHGIFEACAISCAVMLEFANTILLSSSFDGLHFHRQLWFKPTSMTTSTTTKAAITAPSDHHNLQDKTRKSSSNYGGAFAWLKNVSILRKEQIFVDFSYIMKYNMFVQIFIGILFNIKCVKYGSIPISIR